MENNNVIFACLLGLVALVAGAAIPLRLIEFDIDDSLLVKSHNLIRLASLFFTVFMFGLVGDKWPRLKEWATNSILGIACVLFLAGFSIFSASSLYMLIPMPSWLHVAISAILALVAAACMYVSFSKSS